MMLAALVLSFASAAVDASEVAPPPPPPARENHLFFEALGNGLLYSVDYERIIDAWHVGFRGGVSYFTYAVSEYGGSGNLTLITAPFVASYYLGLGSGGHKVQLGLGATVLYFGASTDASGAAFAGERAGFGGAATGVIGYRYLPRDGGISFGVGFTPLVRPGRVLAWAGANVGYVF